MGKGDKKTRRGKIIAGSYGKRRPKKKKTNITGSKPEVKKVTPKPKAAAEPKTAAKPKTAPKAKPEAKPKTTPKKAETKKEEKKEE